MFSSGKRICNINECVSTVVNGIFISINSNFTKIEKIIIHLKVTQFKNGVFLRAYKQKFSTGISWVRNEKTIGGKRYSKFKVSLLVRILIAGNDRIFQINQVSFCTIERQKNIGVNNTSIDFHFL